MERKEIQVDGRTVFYREAGIGDAVALLHGFGEDGEAWEPQWTGLSGYRFIIPDLPGTGTSTPISDMTMEGMAAWVYDLLKELGIETCILIGHSMGGYITMAFAAQFPQALKGFGLFHSSAYPDTDEKKATRKKGIAFMQEHGAFEFLKTATPNLFSPETKEKNPSLIQSTLDASSGQKKETLIAYYEAMMKRPDRSETLRTTDLPVLFILGRHDTAIPLKDGLEQSHLPSTSFVHILERSGHLGMVEETEGSNGYLQEFLDFVAKRV